MATAVFEWCISRGGTDGSPSPAEDNAPDGQTPNFRFKTDDTNTIDANNPIPVPGAGTNYSFWKHVFLNCTTAPGTQCDNFRFYGDGTPYAGATPAIAQISDDSPANPGGYEEATTGATIGTTGLEMVASHTGVTAKTSLHTLDGSGASEWIVIGVVPGDSIIDAIGENTDYAVLQMDVPTGCDTTGDLANKGTNMKYDEI